MGLLLPCCLRQGPVSLVSCPCLSQSTTALPLVNSGVPFKRQLVPFRHAVFCVLWSPVQTLLNNYLNCVHYDCSVQSWMSLRRSSLLIVFCDLRSDCSFYRTEIDEDTSLKLAFKFLILFYIASTFRKESQSRPNAEPTLFQI